MGIEYRLSNNVVIKANKTPFASGGEADVYEIISPAAFSQQVLKVYKPDKRSSEKEKKLRYLIANKPGLNPANEHQSVIWPVHLAFDKNSFVGYTMPRANGTKLEALCLPKMHKSIAREFGKFSFGAPGALEARIKLCFNISVALSQIHSFGSYVLVDMKPDNVMVLPNGLISIIDIDSLEVIEGNRLVFPAQVASPEYTPPEYYKLNGKRIDSVVIRETWDRFSVAVIFYRLLFGIHPYTGSLKPPLDTLTNVSDIIRNGLLPVGKSKDKFIKIPPPHDNFFKISPEVRHHFLHALEAGFNNPDVRPSADDWCRILVPDMGTILNRVYPSKSFSNLIPQYNQPVSLKSFPDIKINKPRFLVRNEKRTWIQVLVAWFFISAKDRRWNIALENQQRVTGALKKTEEFKDDCVKKYGDFTSRVTACLDREKTKVSSVEADFRKKRSVIDDKAKQLFADESVKLNTLNRESLKEIRLLEFQIKELFEQCVGRITVANNERYTVLNNQLQQLNQKENSGIAKIDGELAADLRLIRAKISLAEKRLLEKIDLESGDKLRSITERRMQLAATEKKLLAAALEKYQASYLTNALRHYKIVDDKYSIFTDMYADVDNILRNLSIKGITTAADIKGVDDAGRILTANGAWVKIPGVAGVRAGQLNEWRKRKQRQSPSTVPQALPPSEEISEKNKLAAEKNKLDQEEQQIRTEILSKRAKVPSLLAEHIKEHKKDEQQFINACQLKKNKLMGEILPEKQKIDQELKALQLSANLLKSKAEGEFEKISLPLKNKVHQLKQQLKDKSEYIKKEFDPPNAALVEDLRSLDDDFKKEIKKINQAVRVELDKTVQLYNSLYDGATLTMKRIVEDYNAVVKELMESQSLLS